MTIRAITLLAFAITSAATSAETIHARITRITDGDTVHAISSANARIIVRLAGIDAPERSQAYGKRSTEHLTRLLAGKEVEIETDKTDRFGRVVGKITVGTQDACLEQIRSGMAWHFKKYASEQSQEDQRVYAEAELVAKKAGVGLWKDPALPPWDFRKQKKLE